MGAVWSHYLLQDGGGLREPHTGDDASYLANSENVEGHDYTKDYPMIPIIYEGMAFSKFYSNARGHVYTAENMTSNGRPHALANCFSCKTPDYTNPVNEMGDAAYQMPFEDALQEINKPISCQLGQRVGRQL